MLIVDRKATCGFCGKAVLKSLQPNGRFFIRDGKAVCATCRVLRFSKTSAKQMRIQTRENKKTDEKVKETKEQERVWELAEASQRKTKTKKHGDT